MCTSTLFFLFFPSSHFSSPSFTHFSHLLSLDSLLPPLHALLPPRPSSRIPVKIFCHHPAPISLTNSPSSLQTMRNLSHPTNSIYCQRPSFYFFFSAYRHLSAQEDMLIFRSIISTAASSFSESSS